MEKKDYSDSYSEKDFWDKLRKFAKTAGKELVINALKLYYAMVLKKATPRQVVTIIAALGYFICPVDVIPDLAPLGLGDDAAVIGLAVTTLTCCTDPEVCAAAKAKADEWF